MNWQPFLTKLNKIKILAETAQQEGEISRLERDLLASYVRDLYEYLWDHDQPQTMSKPGGYQQPRASAPPSAPVTLPVEKEVIKAKEPVVESVRVPEPVQPPVEEVRVSTPVKEPEKVVQPIETTPVTRVPATANIDPALLAELFAEEKVSDLSDKLASQKVNDLTKAMGINEKIFTIQELFNNDNHLFNQALGHLNTLPDFSNAQAYMTSELIPKLDWTSDKKIKKAATFIKLVRRRYM